MLAINKYGSVAGCHKYKSHHSKRVIRSPFARSHGYGKFRRPFGNDLCIWDSLYNCDQGCRKVRHTSFRSVSRMCDVPNFEQYDKVTGPNRSIYFPILDFIRDYSFTKSSRVLKRNMKYLVVGPGAMGFYAILGAVYALQINGKLNSLEAVAGSSAGSIVAFGVLVAKWDCFKLFKLIHDIDVQSMMKLNLKSFLNDYGMVPAERWRTLFSKLCTELAGKEDFTFKELKEWSGMDFYVSAYNLNLQKSCYFSHHTHPDMSVSYAVSMSIGIPFLFESVVYQDHRYIDLAAFETSPITPFMDKNIKELLAIELGPNEPTENTTKIKSFVDFIQHFISSIMKNRVVYEKPTIFINLKEGEAFNFSMENDTKKRLFYHGFHTAKEYITSEHL